MQDTTAQYPVSLIIPFRNPGAHFRPLLESVATQQVNAPIEVVAVDNGSTDGSAQVAMSFADRLAIRVVDASQHANADYARNVGVRASSADKLLFSDADDELAPGYIATMSEALDRYDFVTSAADCRALNEPWLHNVHGYPPWPGLYRALNFMNATGPNVGIKRELYEKVGGYPEEFSGCQDIAFSWKVQLAGVPLQAVPDAVYRYRHRVSLLALLRQTSNWGWSTALLYRTFREAGMPGRSVGRAITDWAHAVGALVLSRSRADVGAAVVELGYCVGRLAGSVRYRVSFF